MQLKKGNLFTITPRWILLTAMGLFGIFLGLSIRQVIAATFVDPTCTPPGDCNTSQPLFLAPTRPELLQTVTTPVQFGTTTTPRDLTSYGNIILSKTGTSIQSATGLAGPVAIFRANSGDAVMTIDAQGNNTLKGIFVTSTNGNALYAFTSGTGNAGVFDGPVAINNSAGGGSGTLTVAGATTLAGKLTASNIEVGGTLKVGGQDVTGNQYLIEDNITSGGTKTYILRSLAFGTPSSPNNYKLTNMQVMYSEKLTGDQTSNWKPLITDNAIYQECNGLNYSSVLTMTNPLAGKSTNIRIFLSWKTQTVNCAADVTPPPANNITLTMSPSPSQVYTDVATGNKYVAGNITITATASDPETPISALTITTKDGGNAAVNCVTATTSPATCTWTTPNSTNTQTITISATSDGGTTTVTNTTLTSGTTPAFTLYADNNTTTLPLIIYSQPNQPLSTAYTGQVNLVYQANDGPVYGSGVKTVDYYLCNVTPCTSSGVKLVNYYNGGQPIVDGNYWSIAWNTTSHINGTYYLGAVATDNLGHTVMSTTRGPITITNTAPITCGTSTCYPTLPATSPYNTACCTNSCYNNIDPYPSDPNDGGTTPVNHYCCSGVLSAIQCGGGGGGAL